MVNSDIRKWVRVREANVSGIYGNDVKYEVLRTRC